MVILKAVNQSAVVLYYYGLSINSNRQQLVYRPTVYWKNEIKHTKMVSDIAEYTNNAGYNNDKRPSTINYL